MGQRANSKRNASLDDSKRRAAGRSAEGTHPGTGRAGETKGRTGGASGRSGKTNPAGTGGNATRQNARVTSVGRSTRSAKKR